MWELEPTALTYFEVLNRASSFLTKNNKESFPAEWLMRERLNWTKTTLIKHYREIMPKDEKDQYQADINQFLTGKPMQQIIGREWFYHRPFRLTEDTLIPRPETEEWLDRLLKRLGNKALNVLDVGTGTGVLAITQKLERPADEVTALDISPEALAVAKENGQTLGADVRWLQSDLLKELTDETFDLIISNPPYISQNELALMDQSVLEHEPGLALFADNDGLAIYQALAENINDYLNAGAWIALEIGYAQAEAVIAIFQKALPTAEIELWSDFNDLDRLILIRS